MDVRMEVCPHCKILSNGVWCKFCTGGRIAYTSKTTELIGSTSRQTEDTQESTISKGATRRRRDMKTLGAC